MRGEKPVYFVDLRPFVQGFILDLKQKRLSVLEARAMWSAMVETVTVKENGEMLFMLTCGTEVEVAK